MKTKVKNNTGHDIKECSLITSEGIKDVGWFEDGDVVEIASSGFNIAPELSGYIENDFGREILVEGEARALEKSGTMVTKWVFNKVHECDD